MMDKTELHELSRSVRAARRLREKAAAPAASTVSLTKAQAAQVRRAVDGNGLVEDYGTNGLARAGWIRMMERLCEAGLFRRYVHGGYEITDAGRAADGRSRPGPTADVSPEGT